MKLVFRQNMPEDLLFSAIMKLLLQILKKISFTLTFILLETVSLYVFFSSDTYMLSKYLLASENVTGAVDSMTDSVDEYFSLEDENRRLTELNARLIAENNTLRSRLSDTLTVPDSTAFPVVAILRVIKNELLYRNNFIVLGGGTGAGVREGMVVVDGNGLVGFVSDASQNFSVAVSILSMDNFKSSAKLSGTSYTGSLLWNGENPGIVQVTEMPRHADVHVGDTMLTTSYSNVFMEDIPIGRVKDLRITDDNFYAAEVETFVDFRNLDYVYVLELKNKEERDELEAHAGMSERKRK